MIIIGAGPAGLTASRDLSNIGFKVLVIEQNNYLGGGYWLGGYMMNPVTVRAPAQKIWDELGVPYKKVSEGLYLTPGPHAVSKLIAGACDAGVKFLNLTKFDDLVMKNNRVAGIVVNWMPVSALPRNITCVDPIALEAKMVIDASGHDSVAVKRLVDRGLADWKGMNPMYVNEGEEHVVHKTGEIYPGLVAAGMSVTETYGLSRMGPTFGFHAVFRQAGSQRLPQKRSGNWKDSSTLALKISKIVICEEHAAPGIDAGRVVQFLSDTFDVVVEWGGDVSGHVGTWKR